MERDQRQQARAEAGAARQRAEAEEEALQQAEAAAQEEAARQRAEAEEEALQQAEEEARQQEGEARQQAEEAKHQVQRRMSFEEEYRRDEELQLQHQVQRLRVREAPTAAEQLAEQQLKYLRKKMQAELLKEINAVGKFLSNGENSGKILRALKLAIADQINAGWIDPPPRDPFHPDVVHPGGQAEAQAAAQA